MKNLSKKIILFTFFFLFINIIIFSFNINDFNVSNSNIYQKDFYEIIKKIDKVHLGTLKNPLPFMSEEKYYSLLGNTYQELINVNKDIDFYFIIKKFLSNLHDGHTNLYYNFPNNKFLPLNFNWFGDDLYITAVFDSKYNDLLYKKIIKINNLTVKEFENIVNMYSSTDKNNLYWTRHYNSESTGLMINQVFLKHCNILDEENKLKIIYQDQDKIKEVFLSANYETNKTIINQARNKITKINPENYYSIIDEISTIYFQLNKLPQEVNINYIKQLFQDAKDHKIKYLILDLRNNSGGNSKWNDEFLRYIAKDKNEVYIFKGWEKKGDKNINSFDGKHKVNPADKKYQFDGELFVFINGKTFSSATFFTVSIKDNNLGTLIGTPCGNNSIKYGYSDHMKLPNTKMTFQTSIRIWERAYPDILQKESFITPHITISETINDFVNKNDPYWDYFIKNIIKNNNKDNYTITIKHESFNKTNIDKNKKSYSERVNIDKKLYSEDQLKEIEKIYQQISKNWKLEIADKVVKEIITKYPKSNRAGCAILYLAQLTEDEKEKEKLLIEIINKYSDCFYGDGVQVGAYANYLLYNYYKENNLVDKSKKIANILKRNYKDAVDHNGNKLLDQLK